MTPDEITESRMPDRVTYTEWVQDPSFAPIPFKKQRATRLGMWGAVLESVMEPWEFRFEIRYRIEKWRVPSIRIPYIVEPMRLIAPSEGPATISEMTFSVRETEPRTVAKSFPEHRRVEVAL